MKKWSNDQNDSEDDTKSVKININLKNDDKKNKSIDGVMGYVE